MVLLYLPFLFFLLEIWYFISESKSRALWPCQVLFEFCRLVGLVFAKTKTWWLIFLSLSNVRTTLRTKHLSLIFWNCKCMWGNWTLKIGFFNANDLWTTKLKRLVLGVQFPHKCLDFIMKLYIHHHKLTKLHRFKQILCEF